MARKVQVAANLANVQLPNGLAYDAGDQVVLTDAQFGQLPASSYDGNPLIDLGQLGDFADAVVTQSANVAAAGALTSTQEGTADGSDAATTQALANSLKASYNELQADVVALRTKLNAVLTAITGSGKPMAAP